MLLSGRGMGDEMVKVVTSGAWVGMWFMDTGGSALWAGRRWKCTLWWNVLWWFILKFECVDGVYSIAKKYKEQDIFFAGEKDIFVLLKIYIAVRPLCTLLFPFVLYLSFNRFWYSSDFWREDWVKGTNAALPHVDGRTECYPRVRFPFLSLLSSVYTSM